MENSWEKHWGVRYDHKDRYIRPILDRLVSQGKIGKVVVDIGSGKYPVSECLGKDRTVIKVDLAAPPEDQKDGKFLSYDVEKLAQEESFETKKALAKACQKLGVDMRAENSQEQIDTIILSEILNYVDFKQVLNSLTKYLKPGGRFIICNSPTRGNRELFSEKGLKDNRELEAILKENGMEIESASFPWNGKESSELEKIAYSSFPDFIVLVARKAS